MLATLMIAAALAAPHAVESSTGFTVTDGDRYAAWVHAGQVRLLDEETQTTSSVPLPAGCLGPRALGDGQVVFTCGRQLRLLDASAQTWSTVPDTPQIAGLFDADSMSVTGVGRLWIEVLVETGYHAPTYPAWIERATGRLIVDDPGDLSKHADLDSPELFAPLCSPFKRRRDPDYDPLDQFGSPWIAPYVVGDLAIDVRASALVLLRCGSKRTTVITRSRHWDRPVFTGTRVVWIDQNGLRALDGDPRGRGEVRAFDTATGRVRSWPVPGAVNPNIYVKPTRGHIFIDKAGSGQHVTRYAIDLSQRRAAARTRRDG
jgi:hypothetical protein